MAVFSQTDLQAKFNRMLRFAVEHGMPTESLSCSVGWYSPGLYKRIHILWEWDHVSQERSIEWRLQQWRHQGFDMTSGSFTPHMLELHVVTLI